MSSTGRGCLEKDNRSPRLHIVGEPDGAQNRASIEVFMLQLLVFLKLFYPSPLVNSPRTQLNQRPASIRAHQLTYHTHIPAASRHMNIDRAYVLCFNWFGLRSGIRSTLPGVCFTTSHAYTKEVKKRITE